MPDDIIRQWPKDEMVARTLAGLRGAHADDLATRNLIQETGDGIRILPTGAAVQPVWTFYLNDARRILSNIADYDNG